MKQSKVSKLSNWISEHGRWIRKQNKKLKSHCRVGYIILPGQFFGYHSFQWIGHPSKNILQKSAAPCYTKHLIETDWKKKQKNKLNLVKNEIKK